MTNESTNKATPTQASGTFTRRIGYTTYRVGVHFSKTSRETSKEKIARLVCAETQNGKVAS